MHRFFTIHRFFIEWMHFIECTSLNALHWFTSLFDFIVSLHCFTSLFHFRVPLHGSTSWFHFMVPLHASTSFFNFIPPLHSSTSFFHFIVSFHCFTQPWFARGGGTPLPGSWRASEISWFSFPESHNVDLTTWDPKISQRGTQRENSHNVEHRGKILTTWITKGKYAQRGSQS